ncbi:hypothetical protein Enr13x_66710 [Stieleria neptunia]|uniref:Uncharacterized protein n=1 Tax=Stieleria neptunia TaxID=2527979 RepID=A0A518I0W6_9BACT|nr:hypothetical protein Enr13x_66710 [Stieleria neptunia]
MRGESILRLIALAVVSYTGDSKIHSAGSMLVKYGRITRELHGSGGGRAIRSG